MVPLAIYGNGHQECSSSAAGGNDQSGPVASNHPDHGGTGAGSSTSPRASATPKWRSSACVIAAAQFGLAFTETAAIGVEAGTVFMAGEGVGAVADALVSGVGEAVLSRKNMYYRGPGKILNTNGTVAKTMLGHFGRYFEGTFASNSVGEHFGPGDYAQELIPFWNVHLTYPKMMAACR